MILRGPDRRVRLPNATTACCAPSAPAAAQLPTTAPSSWRDLYQVYGGEVNFAYEMLGVSPSPTMWNTAQYRGRDPADRSAPRASADEDVELGAPSLAPFDHPQYGRIGIGGWRKETGRVPPPFMLERNPPQHGVRPLPSQMPPSRRVRDCENARPQCSKSTSSSGTTA
jgi:hypothetical protein